MASPLPGAPTKCTIQRPGIRSANMSRAGTIAFHRSLSSQTFEVITVNRSAIVIKPPYRPDIKPSDAATKKACTEGNSETTENDTDDDSEIRKEKQSAPGMPQGNGKPAAPTVSIVSASTDRWCWAGCKCERGFVCSRWSTSRMKPWGLYA